MNKHELPYDDIIAALEYVVTRHAERTAVVDGDEGSRLTYEDLWARVESGATSLRAAGVSTGDRVAIVAENSPSYLIAVLAVWKVGAVIVTVYPASGSSDMRYSIELADPVLLLTDGRADLSALPLEQWGIPVASLDNLEVTTPLRTATPASPELVARLAMISFSSGTTSRPKAIMVSRLAVYNCAETYREVWHLGPDDRTVVSMPLAWVYGLLSTSLAALVGGGTLVLLRRGRPEILAATIAREGGTFLPGVTATFARLAETAQTGEDLDWHRTLRLCISGGEPRNDAAFARFREVTNVAVLDAYCASECLPLVTYDPETDPAPQPGAAGKLVPRAKLKVLRDDGTDADVDEIGEAFSSGPGLMLGYWGDEKATRKALTDDGWYRTKDLVRVDAKGYVHVVGRLSDLIIRSGTNVSPAEVEAVLREHPAVADAGVVGEPDDVYGQNVVAAVVIRPENSVLPEQLIAFARARLASYKVPGRVVVVPSLPVGTTGKVSRKELLAQLTGAVQPPQPAATTEPCEETA
ncbi:class I adenylate-forming enzyme family protein [Streptomyces sp. NPDC005708]|uniref:class I adenylate-forming enzyme family protein n=1 Tax=Streptomyces sp. NPDC005708 TaxID=3154564 RepID=UPI0033FDE69C